MHCSSGGSHNVARIFNTAQSEEGEAKRDRRFEQQLRQETPISINRPKTELTFRGEHRVHGVRTERTESEPLETQSRRTLKQRAEMKPVRTFVHFVIFSSNSVDRFPSLTIGVSLRNSVQTSEGLLSFPSWLERSNFGPLRLPWCSKFPMARRLVSFWLRLCRPMLFCG